MDHEYDYLSQVANLEGWCGGCICKVTLMITANVNTIRGLSYRCDCVDRSKSSLRVRHRSSHPNSAFFERGKGTSQMLPTP